LEGPLENSRIGSFFVVYVKAGVLMEHKISLHVKHSSTLSREKVVLAETNGAVQKRTGKKPL
jgi:hypothetical protein